MDIIKNPVILGLLAGVVTYLYTSWNIKEKNKKNKKKNKKPIEVNLMIPLVVGIIVWFLVYGYFEFSATTGNKHNMITSINNTIKKPIPMSPDKGFRFAKDEIPTSSSSDAKEFSLLKGGAITVPTKLPDVFIDMC